MKNVLLYRVYKVFREKLEQADSVLDVFQGILILKISSQNQVLLPVN